jgi:hypothetical protein
MIKKMSLMFVFVCGILFEVLGFALAISFLIENNTGAAITSLIVLNILFGLPLTYYPGRKLFKEKTSLFASSLRKPVKLFKARNDKSKTDIPSEDSSDVRETTASTNTTEENSGNVEDIETEDEISGTISGIDEKKRKIEHCEFCKNQYLWDKTQLLYEEYIDLHSRVWDSIFMNEGNEELNYLFSYRGFEGINRNEASIKTGVLSKNSYIICDSCKSLVSTYIIIKKMFTPLNEEDLDSKLAQQFQGSAIQMGNYATRQDGFWDLTKLAPGIFNDNKELVDFIDSNRDDSIIILNKFLETVISNAKTKLVLISHILDISDNLDEKIITLLSSIGKKMSSEEINKRLDFIDPERVKEACEDLYISTKINRDGNHRYSSHSVGNEDTVATKSGYIEEIQDLAKLKDAGIITDAEFKEKKSQLLK